MHELGRLLVVIGAVAILAGLLLMFAPRIPWLGRLPATSSSIVARSPCIFRS
jgi:hypothetical protein